MAGFNNDVMWADNVRFDGGEFPGAVTTDGQLLIGSTAAPNIRVGTLTSSGGTLTITPGAGTINLDLAGGSVGADSFGIDAATAPGTNPTLPTGGGLVTITGLGVAAAAIPVRTNAVAANAFRVEVQRADDFGVSSAANAGLASFNNAQFSVDANGFVSNLNGLSAANFPVQATTAPGVSPVLPSAAGAVSISGATVAAGVVPLQSRSIALNSLQLEVQRASSSVATNATQQGVASFNSAQFNVDANGWVQLAGASGFVWQDSAGGALSSFNGYFATAAAAYTLPVGAVDGEIVEIIDNIGGGVVVTAQGAQVIRIQNVISSAGGTATSTQFGDALRLIYRATNAQWQCCPGAGGNWLLA